MTRVGSGMTCLGSVGRPCGRSTSQVVPPEASGAPWPVPHCVRCSSASGLATRGATPDEEREHAVRGVLSS